MIQLTETERTALRKRAATHPDLIDGLRKRTENFLQEDILAPETGIANWTLFYYCPNCSVMLDFDRRLPFEHQCPVCKKIRMGEPYDSAWWGMVNAMNHKAAQDLSWLYVLTGDAVYARKTADILLVYARRYPRYEVHGNIPYNGPGRIGAQTIDEATFMRTLATAYDRIGHEMTVKEKTLVREQLFFPSAEFLMAHRHHQLHNHEVIISSAIAVIGILFDRPDMIEFALHAPYGIAHQLKHGVHTSGMWFEDCFSYHFYALESFFEYEKFALHTPYSLLNHPAYARMLNIAWDELQPDGSFPQIGDAKPDHFNEGILGIYEFFWRERQEKKALAMLHRFYRNRPRNNLSALLYGVENLPQAPALTQGNCLPAAGESGHIVLRGAKDSYLFLRGDFYGGEHDHYDRLGLSYQRDGEALIPDLGTTGYGAKLHCAYYKNTATHNTVNINEKNQPPADAAVTWSEKRDGLLCMEAVCDWTIPFRMPDSYTIAQWDEEAYFGVRMTRRIAWGDDWWAELFMVDGARENAQIDWVLHLRATETGVYTPDLHRVNAASAKLSIENDSPYSYLTNFRLIPLQTDLIHCYHGKKQNLRLFSRAFDGQTLLAFGPDNPSHRQISYLIERSKGPRAIFAHVFDCSDEIRRVDFFWDGNQMYYRIGDSEDNFRKINL